MTISNEQQDINRTMILNLWSEINQDVAINVEMFKEWLTNSDFFSAPCSTIFHLACKGGLAAHSLNVYELLREKVKRYDLKISESSIIMCALGHDLCKVSMYEIDDEGPSTAQINYLKTLAGTYYPALEAEGLTKQYASKLIEWYKGRCQGEPPEKGISYKVNDQLPLGHGEKSVSILQDFFHLTDEEKLAIRWHMTSFDAGIHFNYPSGFAFRKAADECPLVTLLFTADYEASQILEREVK